jgi:hypothetical protein
MLSQIFPDNLGYLHGRQCLQSYGIFPGIKRELGIGQKILKDECRDNGLTLTKETLSENFSEKTDDPL